MPLLVNLERAREWIQLRIRHQLNSIWRWTGRDRNVNWHRAGLQTTLLQTVNCLLSDGLNLQLIQVGEGGGWSRRQIFYVNSQNVSQNVILDVLYEVKIICTILCRNRYLYKKDLVHKKIFCNLTKLERSTLTLLAHNYSRFKVSMP
jgi:hypothetical protein